MRNLKKDLRSNLDGLVKELKADQENVFKTEDDRVAMLSQLEDVHKELEGEHLNDKTIGYVLDRQAHDISTDYTVTKANSNQETEVLR